MYDDRYIKKPQPVAGTPSSPTNRETPPTLTVMTSHLGFTPLKEGETCRFQNSSR